MTYDSKSNHITARKIPIGGGWSQSCLNPETCVVFLGLHFWFPPDWAANWLYRSHWMVFWKICPIPENKQTLHTLAATGLRLVTDLGNVELKTETRKKADNYICLFSHDNLCEAQISFQVDWNGAISSLSWELSHQDVIMNTYCCTYWEIHFVYLGVPHDSWSFIKTKLGINLPGQEATDDHPPGFG